MTETAFTVSLKLPDDADPEVVARALSDFVDSASLSHELAEAIAMHDPDAPFDGFTVDVDETDPADAVQLASLRRELGAAGIANRADAAALVRHWKDNAEAVFALDLLGAKALLRQWVNDALAPGDLMAVPELVTRTKSWLAHADEPKEGYPDLPLGEALRLLGETGNAWLRRSDDGTEVELVDTGELRIELDPRPEPTPLQALREDDGWLALLLALMVRTERYLQDIPMLGVSRRAAGREELLALLVPTIDRAEELANTVDPDGSVRGDLAAVVAQVLHPTDNTNQEG